MSFASGSLLRHVFFAIACLLASTSVSVQAADQQPFDAKAFQAAQEAGKSILVEIHADWCPTCKAQLPILNKLSKQKGFSEIARFRVDFDSQKDVVKRFRAQMQSTLVLFKGKSELARSIGETSEDKIRAMLSKAI